MSFIDEIKALVGIKAQEEEEVPMPAPEPAPEDAPAGGLTPEEQTAIVTEVMQILEPMFAEMDARIAALEAAIATTTEEASAAAKAAMEAKEGVTFIAKATKTNFIAPVAGVAQEPVQVQKRVGSKSLTTK